MLRCVAGLEAGGMYFDAFNDGVAIFGEAADEGEPCDVGDGGMEARGSRVRDACTRLPARTLLVSVRARCDGLKSRASFAHDVR